MFAVFNYLSKVVLAENGSYAYYPNNSDLGANTVKKQQQKKKNN